MFDFLFFFSPSHFSLFVYNINTHVIYIYNSSYSYNI